MFGRVSRGPGQDRYRRHVGGSGGCPPRSWSIKSFARMALSSWQPAIALCYSHVLMPSPVTTLLLRGVFTLNSGRMTDPSGRALAFVDISHSTRGMLPRSLAPTTRVQALNVPTNLPLRGTFCVAAINFLMDSAACHLRRRKGKLTAYEVRRHRSVNMIWNASI
jgi:hypothetical protein